MVTVDTTLQERAARVRLLVLDVDGVLTDGRIYYGNDGEELKAFNIKDGLGIKLLQRAGIRARELGIADVIQGREDKLEALRGLCRQQDLQVEDCAYMGDDLPDLGAINACGLGMTVADASHTVRQAADWLSALDGGAGAVREACEFILAARGEWTDIEAEFA